MANIKSQMKRIRTNEKNRLRNKSVKSSVKTAIRKFREAAAAGDKDKAARIAKILHAQALLIAGEPLEDPAAYSELVCTLI